MSREDLQEQAIQEEFGLDPEQLEQEHHEEQDELPLDDDPLAGVPDEDRKYAKGWNPEGEKSLEHFISDGKMMEQISSLRAENKKMQNDFETRTKNLVKMHEIQQANLRKDLEAELEEAVNMSDLEKVKRVQQEMAELDDAPAQQPAEVDVSVVEQWNSDNPWIDEPTPKAAYAKDIFAQQVRSGVSLEQAIEVVNTKIAEHYPEEEQQRPARTTTSRSVPGRQSQGRKLSWNDLDRGEIDFWDRGGKDMFGGDRDEYLKTVQDARAGK